MICEALAWDSVFFGLRVSRIVIEGASDADVLATTVGTLSADVLYVVVPHELSGRVRKHLAGLGGICYDRKVTFLKDDITEMTACGGWDEEVQVVDTCSPDLQRLAIASGWCSRFRRDPRFLPYFEPLYLRWIAKACSAEEEYVLVVAADGSPAGMVTVGVREGKGKIGLVAVDERVRGRGFGRRLLAACDRLLLDHQVHTCEVITQRENVAACHLYESSGYHLAEESEIWHVWRTG